MKMKVFLILGLVSMMHSAVFAGDSGKPASTGFENRCGWVENPTPANWSLVDKDGEWLIGAQGGYQAAGDENIPEFPENKTYWKNTNVHYGYGCGCFMVKVDRKEKKVLEIKSGKALPLVKCRADKSLKPINAE